MAPTQRVVPDKGIHGGVLPPSQEKGLPSWLAETGATLGGEENGQKTRADNHPAT
jgi:hypothetical protein